jgi:hypothetical protein
LLKGVVLLEFTILGVLIFLAPFLISLALTQRTPELRIVPPSYIALIGFVWVLIRWFSPANSNSYFAVLSAIVIVIFGLLEDNWVIAIDGITTNQRGIYFEHLLVYAEIEKVKDRFCIPEIKNRLGLSDRIEGDAEEGYVLNGSSIENDFIKIYLNRNKQFSDITDLKIVSYSVGKYNLIVSPYAYEIARLKSIYIRDILINREPKLSALTFSIEVDFTNEAQDSTINCLIDDMQGYYVQYKKLPRGDLFKVLGIAGLGVAVILLVIFDQPILASLSGVLEVIILILELPELLKRRKHAG